MFANVWDGGGVSSVEIFDRLSSDVWFSDVVQ